MTAEEGLIHLREEKRLLREQVDLQRKLIDHQQEHNALLEEQDRLLRQQIEELTGQVKALHERLAKDSHNSHLPPSSDRFVRQPKSLRTKSGKKPGGQAGHSGSTLLLQQAPDEVVRHEVARCQHCQADLHAVSPAHFNVAKWSICHCLAWSCESIKLNRSSALLAIASASRPFQKRCVPLCSMAQ